MLQTKDSFDQSFKLLLRSASRPLQRSTSEWAHLFVVCGASIRVLYKTLITMAAIPDFSGCCAYKFCHVLSCRSWHWRREQDDVIHVVRGGGGTIGCSYEGLYLPQIWTSVYVVTQFKTSWDMTANISKLIYELVQSFRKGHNNK